MSLFKNPILEVTPTYATVKKFTLGSYPTIFSGVTIYNVFALVISVLQWKIGSGGTLVGQICGEHARGKRPLPVGGWVAQTWVTSKCLLRLSSHTFSSPVLLHPFDEALTGEGGLILIIRNIPMFGMEKHQSFLGNLSKTF